MDEGLIERLVGEVQRVCRERGPDGAMAVESALNDELGGFPLEDRVRIGEAIAERLRPNAVPSHTSRAEDEVLSEICSLLLGRPVSKAELSSGELLERLGESLNTIFDSLNQLVGIINLTLASGQGGEETIRHVIGGHLAGDDQRASLESYLGQIRDSFLVTQKAFKKAAYHQFEEVLSELNPEAIASAGSGGLKFGALRKADFFDIYEQRFKKVKEWFDSGRFMEALLREFEKNAQRLSVGGNPYQGGVR